MTDEEANEIYRRIFTVYPDYLQWLQDRVPDPPATMGSWRRMLASIPLSVADVVASELESGTRQMPKAYDRGQFGAILRSWCQRIVDDKRRSDANERIRDEGRKPAITYDSGLMVAYRKAVAAAHRYRSGEIDEAENCRLVQQAIAEMPHNKGGARCRDD